MFNNSNNFRNSLYGKTEVYLCIFVDYHFNIIIIVGTTFWFHLAINRKVFVIYRLKRLRID